MLFVYLPYRIQIKFYLILSYLLYVERQRCILQEVYKSIHYLGPRYLHELFIIKDREYDYRNVLNIELSKYKRVTYGKNTLPFFGVKLFNSL